MQERELVGHEWADMIGAIMGTGRAAEVASWKAIVHLTRNLESFRPGVYRGLAFDKDERAALNTLTSHPEWDEHQVRGLAMSIPSAFGRYRSDVTEFEASESAKLETLTWALRKLAEMKLISTDKEKVGAIESAIGAFLWNEWRVKSVPMTGDARPAASRRTRRFDLLPMTWRHA